MRWMMADLSRDEQRFVDDLLTWDEKTRGMELLLSRFALALGGIILVITAVLTLGDLTDGTVVSLLIPGFVAGIFLISVYIWTGSRVRDRHRIASLARKLTIAKGMD
jgi:hypothetical protein